jgi:hypothetical protein
MGVAVRVASRPFGTGLICAQCPVCITTTVSEMSHELLAVATTAGQTFIKIVPISIAVAPMFTVLTWF